MLSQRRDGRCESQGRVAEGSSGAASRTEKNFFSVVLDGMPAVIMGIGGYCRRQSAEIYFRIQVVTRSNPP